MRTSKPVYEPATLHPAPVIKTALFLLLPLLFLLLPLLFLFSPAGAQQLHLNEVMSANATVIADEDGDYENWVEIYNSGDEPVSLEGYGLSDDRFRPFRWTFPDVTIPPGDFLLVWASGKDRSNPAGELHTSFGISADGDEVVLTDPDTNRVDYLPPTVIPGNTSIGRQPDGIGGWVFFADPTPGSANITEGLSGKLDPPQFSQPGGFHSGPVVLEIFHSDPRAATHYTLDGSRPTRDSPRYDEPIRLTDRSDQPDVFSTIRTTPITQGARRWMEPAGPVRKANVVRAKAFRDGSLPTGRTQTYFVFSEGADAYDLPVVSLATDSTHLFDYDEGIYVPGAQYVDGDFGTGNYIERGIEWEHPASFELYEKDGSPGLEQDIGIRIHGGYTRRFPQKSLRLYARAGYDESRFNYRMFREMDDDSFNRFILRASGNDFGFTMFMDAAAQSLIRHFNVDTQAYRPVIVFINGEYWGIHNVRERYDRRYLERVYGADPGNIDLLTGRRTIKEGDHIHYSNMVDYIDREDLSDPARFDSVKTMMDIDNFLDYYSAEIYYGNNDWPHNNIDFWRAREPYNPGAPKGLDGRWRWLLFDVDRSLGYSTHYTFDMIEWVTAEKSPVVNQEWPNLLLRNLLENEDFHNRFINRLSDHLNTAFSEDRVPEVVDSLRAPLAPVIDEHILRWQNHGSRQRWDGLVGDMREYGRERPAFMRRHMKEHFDIGSEAELSVAVSDDSRGFVRVNTTDIRGGGSAGTPGVPADPYPWTGIYFSKVPVTLTAVPFDGYAFSRWSCDGGLPDDIHPDEETISVFADPEISCTAHFKQAEDREVRELVYYWLFTDDLPNNTPLKVLEPSYVGDSAAENAPENEPAIRYQPAIAPYPPETGVTAGILDRVNDPAPVNLDSTVIEELGYIGDDLRGIRARNPSLVDDRESALILDLPTTGIHRPVLTFAARRTGSGQEQIKIEYNTSPGDTGWTSEGLDPSVFTMYETWKQVTIPFGESGPGGGSGIAGEHYDKSGEHYDHSGGRPADTAGSHAGFADDHSGFRVRILFRGDEDVRRDVSGNVRFNNFSLHELVRQTTADNGEGDDDDNGAEVPDEFALLCNYPNPFNESTTIAYAVPGQADVTLELYDIMGRRVATLAEGQHEPGRHQVTLNASGLSSGVYVCRLAGGGHQDTIAITLVK